MPDGEVCAECGAWRCRGARALHVLRECDYRVQIAAAVERNSVASLELGSVAFPENVPEQEPVLVLMLDSYTVSFNRAVKCVTRNPYENKLT
jgi:hypothetical protein